MNIKELVAGGVVTLLIGGTAYTVNQADIAKNFANDTGLSQQQAEEYVNSVSEDELVPFDELGQDYLEEGRSILEAHGDIDCINYQYEWESYSLSCSEGKAQMKEIGDSSILLGQAFIKLSSDTADRVDIRETIRRIDRLNSSYEYEIVNKILDYRTLDEAKKNNSYNKALLQAALDSE